MRLRSGVWTACCCERSCAGTQGWYTGKFFLRYFWLKQNLDGWFQQRAFPPKSGKRTGAARRRFTRGAFGAERVFGENFGRAERAVLQKKLAAYLLLLGQGRPSPNSIPYPPSSRASVEEEKSVHTGTRSHQIQMIRSQFKTSSIDFTERRIPSPTNSFDELKRCPPWLLQKIR